MTYHSHGSVAKYSSSRCFLRDRQYPPHNLMITTGVETRLVGPRRSTGGIVAVVLKQSGRKERGEASAASPYQAGKRVRGYCLTAVPASTLSLPFETSTRLMTCLLVFTWMLKSPPQPDPQLKFAVPDPLAFSEVLVKVWVLLLEAHPVLAPVRVPDAVPLAFRVPTNSKADTPHPVLPTTEICHGPANWAMVIAGFTFSCAALTDTIDATVAIMSSTRAALRVDLRSVFIVFSF